MNPKSVVQYVGCKADANGRECTFSVRDGITEREFRLSILNEAFAAQRARFQDAAEICSIRLRHELDLVPDLSPGRLFVTDADLEAYRVAHSPKKANRFTPRTSPGQS